MDVFAATASMETVSNKNATVVRNSDTESATSNEGKDEDSTVKKEDRDEDSITKQETEDKREEMKKQEMEEKKKEREKTINDINTFLIESYKLKIDRILANLNLSIERVTNNNPVAQAKLLEKIRGDVNTKIQIINSRNISENRRKILFSVFSYIQENLDNKISHLIGQK